MPSAWRSPGASAAPCCPESGCKSGRHRVNADGDVAVGHSVHGRRVHSALTPAPCSWAAASRHCLGAQDSTSSCRRATHRVTRDHSPLDRGWYPSASPSFTARDGLDPPSEPGAPAPGVYIHRPRLGLACCSLTDLGRVERGRSWWISRCARRLGCGPLCARPVGISLGGGGRGLSLELKSGVAGLGSPSRCWPFGCWSCPGCAGRVHPVRVTSHGRVDDVGQTSFQAAEGFHAGLAGFAFA